jgi:UDP-glucose 4-epimerase
MEGVLRSFRAMCGLNFAATSAIDECVFSVAGGVETSSPGSSEALLGVKGFDLAVEYGPALPLSGVTRRLASTEVRARDLGFTAAVNLDDGFRQLIGWGGAGRALQSAPAGALV